MRRVARQHQDRRVDQSLDAASAATSIRDATTPKHKPLAGIVVQLTSVNAVVLLFGVITGPLLARALGPEGRGAYAAVLVPISLAPSLLSIGLPAFMTREAAAGVSTGRLIGSLAPAMLVVGAACMVSSRFVSASLGDGRHAVEHALFVGMLLLPINLFGNLAVGIVNGLERWSIVLFSRTIPAVLGLVATVALYATGNLTVATASAVFLVGAALSGAPAMVSLRRSGPWRFDPTVVKRAIRFGPAAWLWQLASITNARLDQLLMVSLASARQLGLYAVAVTVAGLCNIFVGALGAALLPRIVSGGQELGPRALRTTLLLTTIGAVLIAIATPVVLPLAFGAQFRDAVPMVWLLLVGAIPAASMAVLVAILIGADTPRWAAVAEVLALLVTVTGLPLLLPPLGGLGAALTSVIAYTCSASVLLAAAVRVLALPLSSFLVPRRDDVAYIYVHLATLVRKRLPRRRV